MDFINLSHGSLFMFGAYASVVAQKYTDNLMLTVLFAALCVFALGLLVELLLARRLYRRSHLDQVLVTYGLILLANESASMIWGTVPVYSGIPESLSGQIALPLGIPYPAYRLVVIGAGVVIGAALFVLIQRTRIGMLVRAGATSRETVALMGVNIGLIFTLVFALGALLAGVAGALAGPLLSVQPGMGENVLILSFVVVVIGGLGSIRGALVAAMMVGLLDTMGRAYLRDILSTVISPAAASDAGPAIASMLVYIIMALILFFRPEGLMPIQKR
jgi:branched-subunit amino acid ABC-type transport system permease component